MGSNPIPSTKPSDRILYRNNKSNEYSNQYLSSSPSLSKFEFKLRDLYNREKQLQRWMHKVNTQLDDPDRSDILQLVAHLQDTEKSILWIIRYLTALLLVRKVLNKPFRDCSKNDIKIILDWMKTKEYKRSTHEKFRVILKSFFKIVYGNNEYYPDAVNWFSVNVSKEIRDRDRYIDTAKYLEEEELEVLIEAASSIQKKAFIGCTYESGARPEEILRITNADITIDAKGAILILRGKTGERRVRIIAFTSLLKQWLQIHPLRKSNNFAIWISEATNHKNEPLGLRGAEKIISDCTAKAGLVNKHATLYLLRHSRATHLANHFTEAQMCAFFGWRPGTKVVSRYIHLSGKDLDNALAKLTGGKNTENVSEYRLKPSRCIRCSELMEPTSNFCKKCSLPKDLYQNYLSEKTLENENQELRAQLNALHQDLNQKFTQILKMIQTNKKLAYIKPDTLMKKIDLIKEPN